MRYPPERKEATRQRILAAAGTVFRRLGYSGAGVDAVMAEAGLTPGGFYAHFSSKEALFAAVVPHALRKTTLFREATSGAEQGLAALLALVRRYLSPAHRGMVESGCPLPPLLAEIGRAGEGPQKAFEEVLREALERMQAHLPGGVPAAGLLALMIGGITLARAVADDALADAILAACRALAERTLESESPAQPEEEV
jgi:TetR/AcrR family transcriptional repressor of nem operon